MVYFVSEEWQNLRNLRRHDTCYVAEVPSNSSLLNCDFLSFSILSIFLVQILSWRGYRLSREHLKYDVISREFKVHTHANTHAKFCSRIQSGSWQAPLPFDATRTQNYSLEDRVKNRPNADKVYFATIVVD